MAPSRFNREKHTLILRISKVLDDRYDEEHGADSGSVIRHKSYSTTFWTPKNSSQKMENRKKRKFIMEDFLHIRVVDSEKDPDQFAAERDEQMFVDTLKGKAFSSVQPQPVRWFYTGSPAGSASHSH